MNIMLHRAILRKSITFAYQARRQDLAAGGPKTRKRGQKPEGGHIFKILYWIYEATRGPNVKWWGTDLKWGSQAPLPPPAGDGPVAYVHLRGNKSKLGLV